MNWTRMAALVRDRLVLSWLAGGGFWLAWLVSLGLGGWRHDAGGHRVGADHVQYYVVGQMLAEGEADSVYNWRVMEARQKAVGGEEWKGFLPFRYPPFYAFVFAPTSRLSYEASYLVWTLLGLGCLVASGWLLVRLPEPGERRGVSPPVEAMHTTGGLTPRRSPLSAFLLAALCFYPVFTAVSYGQNSLVSLLLISATAALWLRERMLLAGLVAGLLLFKPPLAVGIGLLLLLDVKRSWLALVGMTITAITLVAVAWFALPEMTQAFLDSLGSNVVAQEKTRTSLAPLYSSQGFWQLLLGEQLDFVSNPLALLTSVTALIVFLGLCWRWRAHRPALFGLAVLMTPWLSPYLMVYDWTILLVPAVLFYDQLDRDRWMVLAAILWAVAILTFAFVQAQLKVSPIAVQLSLPVLIACVLAVGEPRRQRFV